MSSLQPSFAFDANQSSQPKATTQFSVEMSPPLIKSRPMCVVYHPSDVARLQTLERMMREAQE